MLRSFNLKRKLKVKLKFRFLSMFDTPRDKTHIPASLNDNFNYILKLHPRVTSFQEHVSLFNLSAITDGDIIEVGCYLCYSSIMMATAFRGSHRKVYAIDMFDRQQGWSNKGTDNWIYEKYSQREFAQKVIDECGLSDSIVLKQGRSEEFVEELSKLQNVGLIFIDGDHSYQGCKQDIEKYSPILQEGGLLVMHDYACAHVPGVKQAVDEFLNANSDTYTTLYLISLMLVIRKESSG